MRIGLIVNPLAGIGGPLALKGSDAELGREALAAGAAPSAGKRAALALRALAGLNAELLTSAGPMGEDAAREAGLAPSMVHRGRSPSTPKDTAAAATALAAAGVDLLVFAGGDGTARDLLGAGLGGLPVLGIPAGVKMHSAVFATSPAAAGAALAALARGGPLKTRLAEIVDREAGGGAPRLYGGLQAPIGARLQAAKASPPADADAELLAAASAVAEELHSIPFALVGPGATMLTIKDALGGGTLLGVDAYSFGVPVAWDVDHAMLRNLTRDRPVRLVLGVVGGQGFLLGRGNQQIGADIVRRAGRDSLEIVAGADKLAMLADGALLVDSGDAEVDRMLAGYVQVRTGPRRRMMMRIDPA